MKLEPLLSHPGRQALRTVEVSMGGSHIALPLTDIQTVLQPHGVWTVFFTSTDNKSSDFRGGSTN